MLEVNKITDVRLRRVIWGDSCVNYWLENCVLSGGDVHENGNREEGLTVAIGCVLKEVYRLFPPFFGGRKVANQEIQLGNYTIDKGQVDDL